VPPSSAAPASGLSANINGPCRIVCAVRLAASGLAACLQRPRLGVWRLSAVIQSPVILAGHCTRRQGSKFALRSNRRIALSRFHHRMETAFLAKGNCEKSVEIFCLFWPCLACDLCADCRKSVLKPQLLGRRAKTSNPNTLKSIPRYLIPGCSKHNAPHLFKHHVAPQCASINDEWRLFAEGCLRNRYSRGRILKRGPKCMACSRKLHDRARVDHRSLTRS
jgi:hypothetical protein